MITAAAAGLATGLTLIVAIGAQNAFVLRQGIARRHVRPVVAVCAVSDLVLIAAGVAGVGVLVERAPAVLDVVTWLGVAFLVGYGVLALRRAAVGGGSLESSDTHARTAGAAVATALALTWLNPHVYLDTVVFLGTVAATHGADRWWFGVGAGLASIAWFAGLGLGARFVHGLFTTERSWRVLDAIIGVTMIAIAVALARR